MLLYISYIMKSENARLFSGDFPKHAKISRASTTITIKYVYGFPACTHRLGGGGGGTNSLAKRPQSTVRKKMEAVHFTTIP